MPIISVIMPSYNVKNYIAECVESVCNQTLQDIEILSIDAVSEDGTLEILREYEKKDSRVKVILSEQKSYGYQVNKGIEMARGEYIAIVETDDIAESNMLEVLYRHAKEHALDYVKGDYAALVAFEDGTTWKRKMRVYPRTQDLYGKVINPRDDLNAFLQDVYLWRGIYKKDFLVKNNIKFNETRGAAYQDVGFLFQTIAHAKKAMYVSDIVYKYRQNNVGSSVYNPKAYSYLLGEYPFVRRQLEKVRIFENELKTCYYSRMFLQIMARYRTMAASGKVWENTKEDRQELWKIMNYAYHNGYMDEYLLGKKNWHELQQYLIGEESYWQYKLSLYNTYRNCLGELLEIAKKAETIVFYSKSMVGGFVYCILKKAGIHVPICFCDNDTEKQGTFYMNVPVISVEVAVANNPNAFYVIANRNFDQRMRQQLTGLGITKDNIYVWMPDIDILMLHMEV